MVLQCTFMATMPMQRLCVSRVTPIVAGAFAQKRALLPGQENDPNWISINSKIERFKEVHGLPSLSDDQIVETRKKLDALYLEETKCVKFEQKYDFDHWLYKLPSCLRDFFINFYNKMGDQYHIEMDHFKKQHERSLALVDEVLKNHGLSDKVKIHVQLWNENYGAMAVGSHLILVKTFFTEFSDDEKVAVIEREISSIIHDDTTHKFVYLQLLQSMPKIMMHKFYLLLEQRADIHSALQSSKNAEILIKRGAICAEAFKRLESEEYRAGSSLHIDDPAEEANYLERMLVYMQNKERNSRW